MKMNSCISNEPKHFSILLSNRTHLMERKCSNKECSNCSETKITKFDFNKCFNNNTLDSRIFKIDNPPTFSNRMFFMKFYHYENLCESNFEVPVIYSFLNRCLSRIAFEKNNNFNLFKKKHHQSQKTIYDNVNKKLIFLGYEKDNCNGNEIEIISYEINKCIQIDVSTFYFNILN
jgi:hypothetical protein